MGAFKQSPKTINREQWLENAIEIIGKELFTKKGYKLPPKIRVSVGFPYGSRGGKAIGQHWHPNASTDKVGCIFISPTLGTPEEALGTLVHELVHASVGNEAGHGPIFKKCALDVGLEGKMRSTTEGPELKKYLKVVIKNLGKYPHALLSPADRPNKKQSTRMIKMECTDCGYKVRASMTKILEHGPVLCPCTQEPMSVEVPKGE